MIILGIDPALTITGYGVINARGNNLALVEAGIIKTSAKEDIPTRLNKIYCSILKLISDTKPDCLVLEKVYSHYAHPQTAFILGQARGVICLATATKKIPLVEYAATRVKKSVVGAGHASKLQVQRMVIESLGLKITPQYTDVTDALALAITHSFVIRAKI